jgi:hypothetical protein
MGGRRARRGELRPGKARRGANELKRGMAWASSHGGWRGTLRPAPGLSTEEKRCVDFFF